MEAGVHSFGDVDEVTSKISSVISRKANDAIKERGVFKIGLSGGSLPAMLAAGLPLRDTDWSKWRVFFCDERLVPLDHKDSTYGLYKRLLMPQTRLKDDDVFPVNPALSVSEASKDYESRLRACFPNEPIPRFDLLVLGMGPDGHTCSLFPEHKLLEEKHVLMAPISDSPKPPPQRITMTLPLLNNSRHVMFVACGENKAETLKRILVDGEKLPAGLVSPTDGTREWFLDKSAARLLPSSLIQS